MGIEIARASEWARCPCAPEKRQISDILDAAHRLLSAFAMRSLSCVALFLFAAGCDGLVLDARGVGPSGSPGSPTEGEPTLPPGRVTMRRLNRTELENTVQDV